jgi:hypothetical protein
LFSGPVFQPPSPPGKTSNLYGNAFRVHQLGGKLVLIKEGMSAATLHQHLLNKKMEQAR